MKKIAVLALSLGLLVGGLLGFATPASASNQLTLSLVGGWNGLDENSAAKAAKNCYAGNDPFDQGSKVKVTNESGRIVGIGTLKWKVVGKVKFENATGFYVADCVLTAKFPIDTARFYDFSIAGEDGGQYTYSELRKDNWKLVLSWS